MTTPKPASQPELMEYRICLGGIHFRGRHGASRAERDLWQDFAVDLDVTLPTDSLPSRDDRSSVYDYDALANLVVRVGTEHSFKLLETLAQKLLQHILRDTPATAATIRLRKFGPPTTASIDSITIELSSRPATETETSQLLTPVSINRRGAKPQYGT